MSAYPYSALITAGVIFGFIAAMHLLRLIYKPSVIIAGKTIPIWVSSIGFILPLLLSIWMFTASCCLADVYAKKMNLTLQSTAFKNEAYIPPKYTCDSDNVSPPLSWQGEPNNTKSFVLFIDDPDATNGTWDHWVLFNIPKETHELTENLTSLPNNAQHGKNSKEETSYSGPCPPSGEHRYYFKLYALDAVLDLPTGATKSQVEAAMKDHIVASGTLLGRYKKL